MTGLDDLASRSKMLMETHTLTEVRNESSDSDRPSLLMETMTFSKATGEARDSDESEKSAAFGFKPGSRVPLLFTKAVETTHEAFDIGYDEAADMATDSAGNHLHVSPVQCGTMTKTNTRNESADSD